MANDLKPENRKENSIIAFAEAIKWMDCVDIIVNKEKKQYYEVACAMLCYSIEVFIKALLVFNYIGFSKRHHNIKKLFNKLPLEIGNEIENEYNLILQRKDKIKIKTIEIPSNLNYKSYNNFKEFLDILEEYDFVYYRYVYEEFDKHGYLVHYYNGLSTMCEACYNVCKKILL